jgi:predicted ATP-dependent endonuclease of OLD family
MRISKIIIENFKSISELEFDIKKFRQSYTTVFIGINETGKSNILQAMSYFNTPNDTFDYNIIHNQKDDKNQPIDIWFHLSFEKGESYVVELRKKISNSDKLNFKIENIVKNVYLQCDENEFSEDYSFDISLISKKLFIKKSAANTNVNGQVKSVETYTLVENNDEDNLELLTNDLFEKYFAEEIKEIIKKFEPKASLWRPSKKFLISDVDLNKFKSDINSNIPLKHIFVVAGFKTRDIIEEEINKISNAQLRRKLMTTLSEAATKYIKKIWHHNIAFDIEITENGKCNVSIKDDGENNKHNYHKMSVRSEGFKQFVSLILSISIETKELNKRNSLILIDEPEAHLHPSGIRDLKKELIKIGKKNYLFVSTHSPFLVDKIDKERNIIIRKNSSALTEKKHIKSEDDLRDDEVLDIAFGINVYKDLLFPHRILVEGASDKIILNKTFNFLKCSYGITNGAGSNIVQIASKLNYDDISILVIVDDDNEGRKYKFDILKIEGAYSEANVFTLRDLVGEMKNKGTIEDLLKKDYITSKFKDFYNNKFNDSCDLVLDDLPFIEQIKIFLQRKNRFSKEIIESVKKIISDDFTPSAHAFNTDLPLLKKLGEKIKEKLNYHV